MLPTEKASKIWANSNKSLNCYNVVLDNEPPRESPGTPQHLYILSDDKIKEGDWCIYLGINNRNSIHIARTSNDNRRIYHEIGVDPIKEYGTIYGGLTPSPHEIKKIIATTDSNFSSLNLPSIPQSFILKYVNEYNKGNKIEEVIVEYIDNGEEDWIGDNHNGEPFWNEKIELKLNPDNTINIKPVKDSWTRDEVTKLLLEFATLHINWARNYIKDQDTPDVNSMEWIEENL